MSKKKPYHDCRCGARVTAPNRKITIEQAIRAHRESCPLKGT